MILYRHVSSVASTAYSDSWLAVPAVVLAFRDGAAIYQPFSATDCIGKSTVSVATRSIC